jgi:TonB-dependent SusC/RagA subfamily outer membrane receptor
VTNKSKEMKIIAAVTVLFLLASCNTAKVATTVAPGQRKEQVVDAGYGKLNKNEVTTHSTTIDGQNLRFASYTNMYDLIKGEVPGVRVNGNTIYIVEPSSINCTNEPLIVVDGTPVMTLIGIEPNMVKSISILKGAAASIYGSRGSGGVILINLLKGPRKK